MSGLNFSTINPEVEIFQPGQILTSIEPWCVYMHLEKRNTIFRENDWFYILADKTDTPLQSQPDDSGVTVSKPRSVTDRQRHIL